MAFTFLKSGKESAALAKQAAAEAEQRKLESGKLWRFWLKEKEEARITFIDGELGPEGFLIPDRYYEHGIYLHGSWNNFFVCPERTNTDNKDVRPICASGDRAALVALFTIIDHRSIPSKDKTKVWKDTKKLFVAKPQTFEALNYIAMKRGGLARATFDVKRVGTMSAGVGSQFEFVEKRDLTVLKSLYTIEKTTGKGNLKIKTSNFTPADYNNEIIFRSGKELLDLIGEKPGDTPDTEPQKEGMPDYGKDL